MAQALRLSPHHLPRFSDNVLTAPLAKGRWGSGDLLAALGPTINATLLAAAREIA